MTIKTKKVKQSKTERMCRAFIAQCIVVGDVDGVRLGWDAIRGDAAALRVVERSAR